MKNLFDDYIALNEPDNYSAPDYNPVEDPESYLNLLLREQQAQIDRELYQQYRNSDNIIRRSDLNAN